MSASAVIDRLALEGETEGCLYLGLLQLKLFLDLVQARHDARQLRVILVLLQPVLVDPKLRPQDKLGRLLAYALGARRLGVKRIGLAHLLEGNHQGFLSAGF